MLRPDRLHRFNRRAHQLRFEFESTLLHEWKHRPLIPASPRKEGNLVEWHKVAWAFHLIRQPIRKCRSELCQTFDKLRLENVEVLWPAEMAQIPNDLRFSSSRRFHNRQHA